MTLSKVIEPLATLGFISLWVGASAAFGVTLWRQLRRPGSFSWSYSKRMQTLDEGLRDADTTWKASRVFKIFEYLTALGAVALVLSGILWLVQAIGNTQ